MALEELYQKLTYELNSRQGEIRGLYRLNNLRKRLAKIRLERAPNSKQKSITDYGWDNLLILDSCRHDRYEKVAGKDIDHRISKASRSPQFIEEELMNESFDNTILISANPYTVPDIFEKEVGRKIDLAENFYELYNLLPREDFYNEEKGTITAERINEFLQTIEKLYPEKRKIVWYMQPHMPFLNSEISDAQLSRGGENIWDKFMKGKVTKEKFLHDYDENIKYARKNALSASKDILTGKTLITSDHGNFLGENGLYYHLHRSNELQLRKVPLEIVE